LHSGANGSRRFIARYPPCAAHWRAALEAVEREQESCASDQTVAGLDTRTELAFDRRGLLACGQYVPGDYGVIITA